MAKKLITVWLSLTVLLFSTITIYAEEDVQGQFLNRTIDINGIELANYHLEDPFFVYQGATYFPLNEEMGNLLGFTVETDWESRTIKILKKEPVQTGLTEEKLKSNLKNPTATVLTDLMVLAMAEKAPQEPVTTEDAIQIPELAVNQLDIAVTPILQVKDTLYLPVRALTGDSCFGWDVFYDDYSGLYISTNAMIAASSLVDKTESNYNRGLANYIVSKNKAISQAKATMLVFLFKHEADINNIDEILLMAMAQKESTFNTNAGTGNGARGIMQIMPSTAKRYGIDPQRLYDAHVNIEFGAKYIGDKLRYYDNKTVALSAYNQGGAAISRGSYSTRYAVRITDAEKSITTYLQKNGYGTGELGS